MNNQTIINQMSFSEESCSLLCALLTSFIEDSRDSKYPEEQEQRELAQSLRESFDAIYYKLASLEKGKYPLITGIIIVI